MRFSISTNNWYAPRYCNMVAIERAHYRCPSTSICLVVILLAYGKLNATMWAVGWPHITCGQMWIQLPTNYDHATARVRTVYGLLETLPFVDVGPVQGTSSCTTWIFSRAENLHRLYHPVESNDVPQVRGLKGLSSDRAAPVVMGINPPVYAGFAEKMTLFTGHSLLDDVAALKEREREREILILWSARVEIK